MYTRGLGSLTLTLLLSYMLAAGESKEQEIDRLIPLTYGAEGFDKMMKAEKKLAAIVRTLKDQALLIKIASRARMVNTRVDAVRKITDRAALARIAVENDDRETRTTAMKIVGDQELFRKVAIEDKDKFARADAIGCLTDQTLLKKFALEEKDSYVRVAAVRKLTDQALLTDIAEKHEDRYTRAHAVAAMDASNPALERLAGDLNVSASDALQSAARVNLAIHSPRIQSRFPRIVFRPFISTVTQRYMPVATQTYLGGTVMSGPMEVSGERVNFVLEQDGKSLADAGWSASFPERILGFAIVNTVVNGGDLLANLLRSALITQADLNELSASRIPELRAGAAANLTDQAVVAQLAVEDKILSVRRAAAGRVTDQAVLARILAEDKDEAVHRAAAEKATDPVLLAKLAAEDWDHVVRMRTAIRLTDRALLAKIARDDKDEFVRAAARDTLSRLPKKAK